MAKECSAEECWREWYRSGDGRKMAMADAVAPRMSVREELMSALREDDRDRALYVGDVIRKYAGPRGEISSDRAALRALEEIRSYVPNKKD